MSSKLNSDSAAKNSTSIIPLTTNEKVMKEKSIDVQKDAHVVKHLNTKELPIMLQKLLSYASSDAEKDILLFSVLVAVSSVIPNVYFKHGKVVGKTYFPNLMCIIESGAATGKGIAKMAIDLIKDFDSSMKMLSIDSSAEEIEDDEPVVPAKQTECGLLLPANSTYPALVKAIKDNDGKGLLFTTEADDLNSAWCGKSSCDASILFRKNFEHEMITYSRKKDNITIQSPHFSVLLTGTFAQIKRIITTAENGLLSRFMFLVLRDVPQFDPCVFQTGKLNRSYDGFMRYWKSALKCVCNSLGNLTGPIEFCFTPKQIQEIGNFFIRQNKEYQSLGNDFISSIFRIAVMAKRIALVLSFIRLINKPLDSKIKQDKKIYCSDQDFQNCLILSGFIIKHSADYYDQIGEYKCSYVPSSKSDLSRKQILALVPNSEFTRKEIVEIARKYNFSQATVGRALDASVNVGEIERTRQGVYRRRQA